jgi:hypothetical protein
MADISSVYDGDWLRNLLMVVNWNDTSSLLQPHDGVEPQRLRERAVILKANIEKYAATVLGVP